MKKIIKLLLPIIIFLLCTVKVFASNECVDEGHIREADPAMYFGFKTNVNICNWYRSNPLAYQSAGFFSGNYTSAVGFADEDIRSVIDSLDAKSSETITVKRCDDPDALIEITTWYDITCYSEKVDSCHWVEEECNNPRDTMAEGDDDTITAYYCCTKVCPRGYTETSGGKCKYYFEGKKVKTRTRLHATEGESIDYSRINYDPGDPIESGSCTTTYHVTKELLCPVWYCDVQEETIKACTPKFVSNNNTTAYCVNPDLPLDTDYRINTDFDISKCDNSYSTVNCGYGNILIEGEYAKTHGGICDNAINLALRLWGAHVTRKGYVKVGLSNATNPNSKGECRSRIDYVKEDGVYPNVYIRTNAYITNRHFASVVEDLDNIPITGTHFETISCSNSPLGVTCSPGTDTGCGGGSTYQKALDLFYNTVLGNKHMKEHLSYLYGKDTLPTNATVVTSSDDKSSYVKVEFDEISLSVDKGVVIDCDTLKEDDPNYNDIKPFCRAKVTIVDENDNPIGSADMDKCIKGDGCITKIMNFAVCDLIKKGITPVKIIVDYQKSSASVNVRSYIGCNPGDHQEMLALYHDGNSSPGTTSETERIERGETSFQITVNCNAGNCKNYDARTDIIKTDESDKKYNCSSNNTNGNRYINYVSDPSLKCIVNMGANTEKEYYDYGNYFGVNTNLCKVYCSDTVEFNLPGRVRASSGLAFKYDIGFRYIEDNNVNELLSNTVTIKRSCVSEIYHEKNFSRSTIDALRKQYGLDEDALPYESNFTKLYSAVATKAASEQDRKENLNQLTYDLYNCNFYSKSNIPSNISVPKERIIKVDDEKYYTAYDYVKNYLYSSKNNYGFNNCELNDNENTCISYDYIKYDGGAEIYGSINAKGEPERVGSFDTQTIFDMGSVARSTVVSNVKYCKGDSCMNYNEEANNNSELDKESYKMNGFGSSVVEGGKPVNDYAYFEVLTEVGFYNDTTFIVHPMSGYVTKVDNNIDSSYLPKSYRITDKYSYPISKDAYSICGGKSDEEYHDCLVTQQFGTIKTFYRKASEDRLTTALETNELKFNCAVEVKRPALVEPPPDTPKPPDTPDPDDPNPTTPLVNGTIYRNIDLKDPFPNESRIKPSNWDNDAGKKALTEITETADELYNGTRHIQFSVNINSEQIWNLQEFNSSRNYKDNTIIESSCDYDEGKKIYLNCRSDILDNVFMTSGKYGTFAEFYGQSEYEDDNNNHKKNAEYESKNNGKKGKN